MSKWTTISTRLVQPHVKREPEWTEWSALDTLWIRIYSSFLFVYKPKSEFGDAESVLPIYRLIESLGKALVPFYPFAGRLIKDTADKDPQLYCNNQGAVFTHKRYDGVISDLIDETDFQPNHEISGVADIDPSAETFDPSGLPALFIQVTDFLCGTRCLNATWSHGIADGFSGIHFLTSWAQISRGEPIAIMPVHNRSLLTRRKSSRILDGAPARFLNNRIKEAGMAKVEVFVPDGIGCKSFKFSRRKMDELKAEGLENISGKVLSSIDCVSAYLWRSMVELRKFEPHELTLFATLVNGRSRSKEIPAGYFGNCVVTASSVVKVGELLSEPLSYAATVIHDAVMAVDEELVKDWIDWFSVNQIGFSSIGDEPFMVGDPKRYLHFFIGSCMHRFPFYEVDFGSGKPSTVIRNAFRLNNHSFGMFFALPSSTEGDISITFVDDKSELEKLVDQLEPFHEFY